MNWFDKLNEMHIAAKSRGVFVPPALFCAMLRALESADTIALAPAGEEDRMYYEVAKRELKRRMKILRAEAKILHIEGQ